ncbi:YARHG domain-containing protein [Butyrivibrio sp. WCE2006]|uniref:YARHG domain-containing protein n=1 Tax=Butyrivibrio sp. WCE2006 TaxID=1410611 RepID=UPI0005D17B34|nr:YARHG domain-containing protein [Butyrivibrio sp. WCE2006]
MRCHGKVIASIFLTGIILLSGAVPAYAKTTDSYKLLNVSGNKAQGTDNPATYARDDGVWEKNASGIWTYKDSNGEMVRNCWVKDGDMLFFVGYDGCLVKDNYSSDGFYLDADGVFDETKAQRTWDVDPYEGAYEDVGDIWIFSLPGDGNMYQADVAYTQTGEVYMSCDLTPVGHGCFMAWPKGSKDVYQQFLISVSDDRSTVRISANGITIVCTYTPGSYYYYNTGGNNNNSYQNNSQQDYNNQNYNSGNNQDFNSQAYYEFIFPYSSLDTLEDWEVEILSDYELRIAINEIYARHGRRFKDKELQNYFNNTSWYVGMYEPEEFDKIQDNFLNEIEKKNINKLTKERNKRQ